ncbi:MULTISPECIES: hypothetical protein [unclassified Crossiella]|uniref:hypothetical protein n=1 Tax=unclassified Crossiella TaxID=2620835 RepID=UPI001FFE90C2|nr:MULTISPECIES: hypothetical protein [unclassified Crossiella]MCK2239378.1 hypothetical protein [Crossiella sp. S99.2]MCK2252073.1 hypothetical protein [Crossiella sp. S99.1]
MSLNHGQHQDADDARRCLAGELVAEQVSPRARELAVSWCHRNGLTDHQVAQRCRMSTYTAARIRARLSLAAHRI